MDKHLSLFGSRCGSVSMMTATLTLKTPNGRTGCHPSKIYAIGYTSSSDPSFRQTTELEAAHDQATAACGGLRSLVFRVNLSLTLAVWHGGRSNERGVSYGSGRYHNSHWHHTPLLPSHRIRTSTSIYLIGPAPSSSFGFASLLSDLTRWQVYTCVSLRTAMTLTSNKEIISHLSSVTTKARIQKKHVPPERIIGTCFV